MPNGDLSTFKEAAIGAVFGAIGGGAPFSDNAPNATDSPSPGIINIPIFNPEPEDLGPVDPVPVNPNPNSTDANVPFPDDDDDDDDDVSDVEIPIEVAQAGDRVEDDYMESEDIKFSKNNNYAYDRSFRILQWNGRFWMYTGATLGEYPELDKYFE